MRLLTAGLGIYSWLNPQLGQSVVRMHSDRRCVLVGVLNGSLTSGTGLFVTMWLVRWFVPDYRRAIACTLILGESAHCFIAEIPGFFAE